MIRRKIAKILWELIKPCVEIEHRKSIIRWAYLIEIRIFDVIVHKIEIDEYELVVHEKDYSFAHKFASKIKIDKDEEIEKEKKKWNGMKRKIEEVD